jgi:hypothetical protein
MTAIDWLEQEIKNEDHYTEGELGNACIDINTLLMLVEQAKEMHKQEISDEEIEKVAKELSQKGVDIDYTWIMGAKWYREQLSSKLPI